MTLAFGYVRASTSEEVRQGSNERQKEILERFFKDRGWSTGSMKIRQSQVQTWNERISGEWKRILIP